MRDKRWRRMRVVLLLLLAVSIFVSADLMVNVQAASLGGDGIGCVSLLHGLFGIFERGSWSVRRFHNAFAASLWCAVGIGILNILAACWEMLRRPENLDGTK